ncbi:telomerase Cajal body protein 1 [Chelonus insularis]|uniref:telomerase Cajal body protein 1 n=1 Tax=Chelonus insularis TaxID=460826 RepID=UPI00158BD468|nr:telomerase Cajal body protein 1 [Chelonus insularis]XP_034951120.1 telomerase Cajal body protein 1 [Chelonus insularis]
MSNKSIEDEEINEEPTKPEIQSELIDEELKMQSEATEDEQNKTVEPTDEEHYVVHHWSNSLRLLCTTNKEHELEGCPNNHTKGCLWSPDGTCLLVPFADFRIRLYDLPSELYSTKLSDILSPLPLKAALKIKEGGLIYDICWYPWMSSWDPVTCCFLATSKETPVHLWDAFTGKLRATYRAYNQVDEVDAAISVRFGNDGNTIWSGFKGIVRSFDINRPGRQVDDIVMKTNFPKMHGIVSCIRDNPISPGLLAIGTYSKCIGLYKDGPLCLFETDSGVTQLEFSPCGTKLYSAVRRNNEFLCWDLRNPGKILYSLENRQSDTNQRIQFCISHDGSEIISGGTDGVVRVWKTEELINNTIIPSWNIPITDDCVNGVDIHRTFPILASSSGQRMCDDDERVQDNSVRIWDCSSSVKS